MAVMQHDQGSTGKQGLVAILGGSGLAQFDGMEITRREVIRTPYGMPSGALVFGSLHGSNGWRPVVFLPRHGYSHTIPPHAINYRANIWALKEVGVSAVVAVASVGGINPDLTPGTIVLPDQIIDYTHGRASTYFDSDGMPVTHIDFTQPYHAALRERLLLAARRVGQAPVDGGVYACTDGPRLETAAEIERLARDGADMVGMTAMPEACLARELDLPYASLAVVVNPAAGRGTSRLVISLAEISQTLDATMVLVRAILSEAVTGFDDELNEVSR